MFRPSHRRLATRSVGCSGSGDEVDDTPPEAPPTFDCPIGHDTCPGGGVDPIRE